MLNTTRALAMGVLVLVLLGLRLPRGASGQLSTSGGSSPPDLSALKVELRLLDPSTASYLFGERAAGDYFVVEATLHNHLEGPHRGKKLWVDGMSVEGQMTFEKLRVNEEDARWKVALPQEVPAELRSALSRPLTYDMVVNGVGAQGSGTLFPSPDRRRLSNLARQALRAHEVIDSGGHLERVLFFPRRASSTPVNGHRYRISTVSTTSLEATTAVLESTQRGRRF